MLVCGGGIIVGPLDPQRFRVFEEGVLELLGKFLEGGASFARAADRFVVNIGDVHDAMNSESARFEMALEQILENVGAKISDVGVAVNRRPACVDVDLARS